MSSRFRDVLQARLATDAWFASPLFRALAMFLADRLRATTARLGSATADHNVNRDDDEIDLEMMDSVSLATVRFDKMLKRLQGGGEA